MRTFYSFSLRQDMALIRRLADDLSGLGYEPIIPIDRPIRVHHWRSRLAEALQRSDVAIVLLTPENMKNPFVLGELGAARVLSQMNRRFVLVPVLHGTNHIPKCVADLFVANGTAGEITDPATTANEIDGIVRDNLKFEFAISDLRPRVFVGHGHSDVWRTVETFLHDTLNLEVEEYDKTSPIGKAVSTRLEEMLATSSFAIIVMSAEDEQKGGQLRARQNVIHEIGLFQGKLGFERVVVLRHKDCEPFSNVAGINEVTYESNDWSEALSKISFVLAREGLVGNPTGRRAVCGEL